MTILISHCRYKEELTQTFWDENYCFCNENTLDEININIAEKNTCEPEYIRSNRNDPKWNTQNKNFKKVGDFDDKYKQANR